MALSILNYFYWDIPEAKLPFMIADVIVIGALHFVDRGMKAEKELERIKAEKEQQNHESSKVSSRAQKAATREEQKRAMKQQKYNSKNSNGKGNHNIQQPSKAKKF